MPRSFLTSRHRRSTKCSEMKSKNKIFSISDVISCREEVPTKSQLNESLSIHPSIHEHQSILRHTFPDGRDVIASPPSSSSSSSSTIPCSPAQDELRVAGWFPSASNEGWNRVKKETIDETGVDSHVTSPSNQSEGRISAGSVGHSDVDSLENSKHFRSFSSFPFVLNSEQHWKEQTPPVIHCSSQRGTCVDNFPNFLHFWSHEKLACSPFFLPYQWFKASDGRIFHDHPRSQPSSFCPTEMFNFLYPSRSPTRPSFAPCFQPSTPQQVLTDSHACPDCGKRYSTSSNLARHRQSHKQTVGTASSSSSSSDGADKQSRKCPHCDKTYVSVPAFNMHVRTHNQGCVCPHCGKKFSRPWLLQGHLRTHTGEKPFRCSQCSKTFADKSNLRAHIQTHSTEKPFVCGRCKKAFALKSYLYKHEESSCMRSSKFFVGIA